MTAALTLVVCAAPLADRSSQVAATLVGMGWDVTVVATPAAVNWLDPAAIRDVTGKPAQSKYRRRDEPRRNARPTAVVACPATFNTVNKMGAGISDNYAMGVLNEAMANGLPVVAVPVISERLWHHLALAANFDRLSAAGVLILDPRTG